jgi:trans-aconitate methyltransferase
MTDLYYNSILTKRYNPETWWGDAYQENAGLEEMYARVNALDPTLVIDAGCGRNKHKEHIKNLIGIDASPFPEVDINCPILEATFQPNCADVVLALGSVQFISREYIIENMEKLISWVKPGGLIEMRVLVHDKTAKDWIEQYDQQGVKFPWDAELREYITNQYNLKYLIDPWTYQATAPIDVIKKNANKIKSAMAKRDLKRECWTWIKN